jgi:nicotinamidase-related amidase
VIFPSAVHTFEHGSWGGEIRGELAPRAGEIVALEHWGSSGFQHRSRSSAQAARHSSAHLAAKLGYDVLVVKDATASYSEDHMHAALDVNIPNYASPIATTDQIVDGLSSVQASGKA